MYTAVFTEAVLVKLRIYYKAPLGTGESTPVMLKENLCRRAVCIPVFDLLILCILIS